MNGWDVYGLLIAGAAIGAGLSTLWLAAVNTPTSRPYRPLRLWRRRPRGHVVPGMLVQFDDGWSMRVMSVEDEDEVMGQVINPHGEVWWEVGRCSRDAVERAAQKQSRQLAAQPELARLRAGGGT